MPNYLRNLVRAAAGRPPLRMDWAQGTPSGATGYNAATNGRRLAGYTGTTRGPASLALGDGPNLRARARKAALDNQYVVSAIRGFKADVIGDGIKPHFQHPKPKIRAALKVAWDRSVKELDSSFDPSSRKAIRDAYSQQMYVAGEVMEAGEAFARLRPRYLTDGLTVPLQVQLIDAEQLPYWKMDGGVGNNIVRGGVEFDSLGRRVAYHMYRQNPGDALMWPNAYEIVRVPGDSVLHVFEPMRSNPIRGITWLASVLVKLEDLRAYDDAEVLKKKLSTFLIGWTKRTTSKDPIFTPNQAGTQGTNTAPPGVGFSDIEPGTILELDDIDDLGWNAPPDVGTQYETFMRVQLQGLSRVLMRAYHQLSGNVKDANYSSLRADLLNIRRELEQFQFNVMCIQWCDPLMFAWLNAAALAGVIDAQDYAKNPGDYLDVQWRTARWAWVDPEKDLKAEKMMNRSGYKSRSQTVLEMGADPEQVDAEIVADQQRADKSGLVFDSDGRRPDGKGQIDVSPEAEEDTGPKSPSQAGEAVAANGNGRNGHRK